MPDSSMLGKVIKDTYRIDQYLGEGGPSVVYKGTDLLLGRPVAIKMLKLEVGQQNTGFTQRFLREARVQSELIHQNIVAIRAVLEEEGHFFIVMEYVDGGDLEKKLLSLPNHQLELEQIGDIFSQILDGLGFAHSHDIIHRDIKPSNILLTGDGCIKIADFGLARHITDPRLTKTGFLVGTILYMSPEQLKGEELDRRTDLYSVGIMLYEALAGRHPFVKGPMDSISQHEIFGAHLFKEPPPIEQFRPDIPSALKEVLKKSIKKDRDERFQSAEEFKRALRAALDLDTQENSFDSPATPSPPNFSGSVGGTISFSRADFFSPAESDSIDSSKDDTLEKSQYSLSREGDFRGEPESRTQKRGKGVIIAAVSVFLIVAVILSLEFFLFHSKKIIKNNIKESGSSIPIESKVPPVSSTESKVPAIPKTQGDISGGKFGIPPKPREISCPSDVGPMEWIPPGEVVIKRRGRWERVRVSGFCIDRREVTMRDYIRCVDDGVCEEISLIGGAKVGDKILRRKTPLRRLFSDLQPWPYASWKDARDFCRWAGKRLPTEVEWMRAARADKRFRYPWGDRFPTCDRAVFFGCARQPLNGAEERQLGASPFGILDMSGNLAEWTADCYPQGKVRVVNNKKSRCLFRIAKGGSFRDRKLSEFLTTWARQKVSAFNRFEYMGVRCVYSPPSNLDGKR